MRVIYHYNNFILQQKMHALHTFKTLLDNFQKNLIIKNKSTMKKFISLVIIDNGHMLHSQL